MKILIISTLLFMTTQQAISQDEKATTVRKTFSRETTVSTIIKADASIIWSLLTNAEDFSRWNSTVTMFEGKIEEGEKIRLKSILDEKRIFKLKVKELSPESKMVWGDGKGTRIHTLRQNPNGTVTFTMSEKIGGFMFPMYAKYIPPFDEAFQQYASDLKKEAETLSKEN